MGATKQTSQPEIGWLILRRWALGTTSGSRRTAGELPFQGHHQASKDQLFNILVAGRKLQQAMGQKPQIAIIVDILPGTDGEIKMSKSLGNDSSYVS